LLFTNMSAAYSAVVTLRRNTDNSLQITGIQPNPVSDGLGISLYSKSTTNVNMIVYNILGQKLKSLNQTVNNGYSKLLIPVAELPSGTYILFIKGENVQAVKRFIKVE
jgi:Secretion system C-terminal sorting domain